ncbi:hypothetical protein M8332_02075 [Fructilactobacillus ixorae]|uniref:DUF4044 domain-containing protein n=1 Tax=Fructilactobacillus ixorae TaxID=1750535 RepID=A0ABY5C6H0_9LACO|nr:hypothetical protein [Fructilactobacillus ixorae]USS93659.1 hypothetical protein M8332_02075 [Fructilactobacillus ixorae]
MKNKEKLLNQALKKRFKHLEENQPAPQKPSVKKMLLKVLIGAFALCFVALIVGSMLNF